MYKFVYPYRFVKQLMLDGQEITVKLFVGAGHIVYVDKNTALCGKTIDEIKEGNDGTNSRQTRADGPLCQGCQEAWKNLPNSPWKKWTGKETVDERD